MLDYTKKKTFFAASFCECVVYLNVLESFAGNICLVVQTLNGSFNYLSRF